MKAHEIVVGMKVRFHPIIGTKHDGSIYTVARVGRLYGIDVAWLEENGLPADIRALSVPRCGADNYGLGMDG